MKKNLFKTILYEEYQDRILYELTKKREKALTRFSHNIFELLKKNLLILQIKDETSILSFETIKNAYNEDFYFISRFYDGSIIKLANALKEAFQDLCLSIIITNDFAIIKEEVEIGHPNIYFIQSK